MNRRRELRARAEYRGPHQWADAVFWLANPLAAGPSGAQAPRARLESLRRALYAPGAAADAHTAYAVAFAAVERDEAEARRALDTATAPQPVHIPRWAVATLACVAIATVAAVASASASSDDADALRASRDPRTGRITVVVSSTPGQQSLAQTFTVRSAGGTVRVVPSPDPTIWKDPDPTAALPLPGPTGNWVLAQAHGASRSVRTGAFHPQGDALYIDSSCVGDGSLAVQLSDGTTVFPRCTPFTPFSDSNGLLQDAWPRRTEAHVVVHGSVVWAITFSTDG